MATRTIDLDGTPRAFGYTITAARELKNGFGMTLLDALQLDPKSGLPRILDSVTVTWLIWAGLQKDRKVKVSFNKTEALLQTFLDNGSNLQDLFEPIGEAAKESGLFGYMATKEEAKPEDGIEDTSESTPEDTSEVIPRILSDDKE